MDERINVSRPVSEQHPHCLRNVDLFMFEQDDGEYGECGQRNELFFFRIYECDCQFVIIVIKTCKIYYIPTNPSAQLQLY